MLQEIITYMIIGSAITIVIYKIVKQFKPKSQKPSKSKLNISTHNCSECAAECIIRDLPKPITETNKETCRNIEEKSKSL